MSKILIFSYVKLDSRYVNVTGDTMTGGLIITSGGLTVDGATVFNEAGADVDFRVEGENTSHLLFTDASADSVGINGTPAAQLDIASSAGGKIGLIVDGGLSPTVDIAQFRLQDETIVVKIDKSGNVGVRQGATASTAYLHLAAGTTAASTAPLKFTTQASPLTAVEAGTMEYVGHSLQFSQFLRRRGVTMSQDVRTSTTTVENTATESGALATVQHGADYLEVGKCEETVLIGTIGQRNHANAVCTFDIKYDGVTIHSISTVGSKAIAAGTPYRLTITVTCRSIGATGTMQINSQLEIGGETTVGGSSLPTVDTTSAEDTTVTAQWGEAHASNILVVQQGRTICIETNK